VGDKRILKKQSKKHVGDETGGMCTAIVLTLYFSVSLILRLLVHKIFLLLFFLHISTVIFSNRLCERPKKKSAKFTASLRARLACFHSMPQCNSGCAKNPASKTDAGNLASSGVKMDWRLVTRLTAAVKQTHAQDAARIVRRGAANYGSHPNVAIRIACVNIYIGIFLKEAGTVNGSTSVFFFKDAASVNNFLEITNQAKQ
jgi:hypothetical protein